MVSNNISEAMCRADYYLIHSRSSRLVVFNKKFFRIRRLVLDYYLPLFRFIIRDIHTSNIHHLFFQGNSGNSVIILANMLWLASVLDSTLIVPQYMNSMLSEFNLSTLYDCYCIRLMSSPTELSPLPGKTVEHDFPDVSKGHIIHKVESYKAFFGFLLFEDPAFSPLLPKYDEETIKVLSRHYVRFYCALWSSPIQSTLDSTNYIISNYFSQSFKYSTVHKRALEGGCSDILSHALKKIDFSPTELPMNNIEWSGDLRMRHPLCGMTGSFVGETLRMHGKQNNKLFVSFDGQGAISSLKELGAVFSTTLDYSSEYSQVERKYVDMHMAIHGDFFILNPRSTFSWQIFLIRNCLQLKSVPIVINTDLYVQEKKEYERLHRGRLWVSFVSAVEAANDLRKDLHIIDNS